MRNSPNIGMDSPLQKERQGEGTFGTNLPVARKSVVFDSTVTSSSFIGAFGSVRSEIQAEVIKEGRWTRVESTTVEGNKIKTDVSRIPD